MEEGKNFNQSLFDMQSEMGCPKCSHCDTKMLGIQKGEFCPKGLTVIGPFGFVCQSFLHNAITGTVKTSYESFLK